eukprot:gnl/Dysnectes_brevis/7266_a12038_350.p1 GENE.gnl/Dysnectes_brevis/7266_a12038_350~~gnl/Dysnectes_brevis/7266_a12038_350.p1  ORF type:complete len:404 (+),score=58.64 gnl/Dysnectes_brevis/7266_a12038_350:25-1236(+)
MWDHRVKRERSSSTLSMTRADQVEEPLLQSSDKLDDYSPNHTKIAVCFTLLGLVNNFGYSISLSAAKDILSESDLPAGVVLAADILPTLIIKAIAPLFVHNFSYISRIVFATVMGIIGFLLPGLFASSLPIALTGVCCASVSSGFGEITFLAFSAKFPITAVAAWSSGTGAAGLCASTAYAWLTDTLEMDYRAVLLAFSPLPLALMVCFLIARKEARTDDLEEGKEEKLASQTYISSLTIKGKLSLLKPHLLPMFSLFLVYLAEYTLNQGVAPAIDFGPDVAFYVWQGSCYQAGVFVSRSSLPLFRLPMGVIWVPAVVQVANLVLFTLQGLYMFMSYGLTLVLSVWEGLMGGLVYAHGMHLVGSNSSKLDKEFCLGAVSFANSVGISIAAFTGSWIELFIESK